MVRRILLIAAMLAAVGGVASAPSAGAQAYGGCNATVSDTTPAPGQTLTVSGTGAVESSPVSATIAGTQVGSGTADADGDFSFAATVPQSASGTVVLSVICGSSARVDAVTLTVGAAAGSGNLPATGTSSTLPMTEAGVAAVLLGALILGGARLRSRSARATSR